MEHLTFAEVIRGLKEGKLYAREGWNGKGMFIYLVPGSTFVDKRPPLSHMFPAGYECSYRPHVDMRDAQGNLVPWLASQTDMLAEDWLEVTAGA